MNRDDAPILDDETLEDLRASVNGDREFVVELVEAYLADGATHVVEVEEALAARDVEGLVRPAHTLKSSSATLGATRLATLARELEVAGRSGTLDAAMAGRIPELRAAWDEAADALRAWVSNRGMR